MVFRGRPSKGCSTCRAKKIRCDQARPACSQCLKSRGGYPCPGYRDEQTLEIVDQSNEVARKAQARQTIKLRARESEEKKRGISSDSSSSSFPRTDGTCGSFARHRSSASTHAPPVSTALVPPIESRAIRYFVANYVVSATDVCSGHLGGLATWETAQSKTLQAAMKAVGLAAMSNQRSDASLMAKARCHHNIALRMTRGHLQDPLRCKQDRTITAVALLGLYEFFTASSITSLKWWMNHITGTIALLNLRGPDLISSESGLEIFTQARSTILVSCYLREAHVPPIIHALGRRLSQSLNPSCRIFNELANVVSDLCEFRACIKDGSVTDPAAIISSMLHLDDLLIDWGIQRSSQWDHITIFDSSNPEDFYDDSYSVYASAMIAGTWGLQRIARILIHEAIVGQINMILAKSLFPSDTTAAQSPASFPFNMAQQRSRSLSIIMELASDICASVPYILGHDRPRHEQLANPIPSGYGYFFLRPLYLAGNTIGVPHSMRVYVLGRVRYIGHVFGINHALLWADILQKKIEQGNEWKIEELSNEFPRQWTGGEEGADEEEEVEAGAGAGAGVGGGRWDQLMGISDLGM